MKITNSTPVRAAAIIAMLLFNGLTDEIFPEDRYQFPGWINKLIEKEEADRVANPPAYLSRCTYKGRIVYYRPPRCCDIPGILYDEDGNVICSPDGGLTGRGDGRCPEFSRGDEKRECEVIWRDGRTWSPLQKR